MNTSPTMKNEKWYLYLQRNPTNKEALGNMLNIV